MSKMPFVQWIHYVAIGLFIHQIHRIQSGPAFTSNSNAMQSLQIQSGRNLRRLPCIIHRTGAEGVCMFSIDCFKANGTHLGTCHDRFYIGSCCKLKDDADDIGAEIVENNIEPSTTSEAPIQRTTSKWLLATTNPAAQKITTTQSTSTKASTSTESQTSKIGTEQNSTNKIETSTTKRPGWIIISNVLSLSSKDSVITAKPTGTVTQSMMSSVSTRFPTRQPQTTSTAKPTTMIPTTTDETFDLNTEESTIFDRSDEITTVTNIDYTTTIQSVDTPTTTEYQSETFSDELYETTTVYDTSTEYEMEFTTAPAEENNESKTPNSTDETMQPMPVTNVSISISFKEEEEEEQTTASMLASTTEPVSSTIAHSPINSINTETFGIKGSSTTKTTTTEFVSTTEEISTSTSIVLNGLEKANYKQVCGKRLYPQPRIVGGSKAFFGRWPWQISLRQWHSSSFLHKCGAALLNENWAITAAHCVDNVSPADLLLRLGEFDIGLEEEPHSHQDRRVQIVVSYPQFDARTFEYDLALMRLHEPVIFQPNIIPVCLPETDDNFIGRKAFVTGWGRLYEDGPLPSVLQEVPVPIINNTLCEGMYRQAGYDEHIPTNSFICAGYKKGGQDSCEGDSGGPLVIQREDKRFLLAGVISWGINCAEPNQPGVYTRISKFREWINQIIQI